MRDLYSNLIILKAFPNKPLAVGTDALATRWPADRPTAFHQARAHEQWLAVLLRLRAALPLTGDH